MKRVKTGLGLNTHSQALRSHFEIERVLQQAIFGSILLARTLSDRSERVVLKAVNKSLSKNKKCRRGTLVFENHDVERKLLKSIRDDHPHENLLSLSPEKHQISDESTTYTCMPFLEGGELFAVVDMEGAQSPEVSRDLVRGIAKGLKHLHQTIGFAHNDISLENVLLTKKGRPVICDYGLAKKIGSKWNSRRAISGKLPYQAPEIYFGTAKTASGKSDVFSLGVTLFVLLCGIPPFDLPDMVRDQRYLYIQKGKLGELLRLWGKDLDDSVVDLVSSMLVNDPSKRASIDDVLNHPWLSSSSSSSEQHNDMEMMFGEEMDLDLESEDEMDFDFEEEKKERKTPIVKTVSTKASPDSVFSFESAYQKHRLES